jgi:GntR family transcriptional regulator
LKELTVVSVREGSPSKNLVPRVSRANVQPLYHQIADDMRTRIRSGSWPAGSRLASETELTRTYGASRITVRQALEILAREGLLSRQPGRGTFVLEPVITAGPRLLTSFTEEMRTLGLRPSSAVLRQESVPAPADVARRLGLQAGDPVIVLERLRRGDDLPIGVQVAHLPGRLFPALERADLGDRSLYAYLLETYGVEPTNAEELFEISEATGRVAELLAVPRGACAFHVERVTYAGTQPIEFVTSVLRQDRYRVQIRLQRQVREERS